MAKKSSLIILLFVFFLIALPSASFPYLLPGTQIIELMSNNFLEIKTLKITQQVILKKPGKEEERLYEENISLLSPDHYRSGIIEQNGEHITVYQGSVTLEIIGDKIYYSHKTPDFLYRFLFSSRGPERLKRLLKETGINIDTVSLSRFEGQIVYMIGEKEEGKSRILIDKDLFLPLALKYGGVFYSFSDYREIKKQTWYPYVITFSLDGEKTMENRANQIILNPPVDVSLFNISLIGSNFDR